jgi:CRP-like cAMP-binding protein
VASGGNHLLAALPPEDMRTLREHLEPVPLVQRSTLYEAGSRLTHLYFPTEGLVSLLHGMADGASAEVAIVGTEGVVGISLVMGRETTPSSAIVQSPGQALRVGADVLEREIRRGGRLQQLLLGYTHCLIAQMSQAAVCNRHHSVEQRLCRWLLMSLDRLPADEIAVTQELIASMLGVRREGVTEAASRLEEAGIIQRSRGRIALLDRPGMVVRSCECYAFVRRENERLLTQVYGAALPY